MSAEELPLQLGYSTSYAGEFGSLSDNLTANFILQRK